MLFLASVIVDGLGEHSSTRVKLVTPWHLIPVSYSGSERTSDPLWPQSKGYSQLVKGLLRQLGIWIGWVWAKDKQECLLKNVASQLGPVSMPVGPGP